MSRRRTPREKKELSYDRDHRNAYGESPHASRKWIPRRKAMHARAWRRRTRQELGTDQLPEGFDEGDALAPENRAEPHYDQWSKQPDKPLRRHVAWQRFKQDRPGATPPDDL